jgi:hypothetical protein
MSRNNTEEKMVNLFFKKILKNTSLVIYFLVEAFQLTRKTLTAECQRNNAIPTEACNKKANRKPKKNKRLLNRPDCGKTILYCASIFFIY